LPLFFIFIFLNFYKGAKSAKFCLDFRHQSPLTPYAIETEKRIGNLKLSSGAAMTELRFDLDILPIPPLIFTGGVKIISA